MRSRASIRALASFPQEDSPIMSKPSPPPSPPISLSDDQLHCLMTIAQPLAPVDRGKFLLLVAAKLRDHAVIGDGVVNRIGRECFAQFWHAPDLSYQRGVPQQLRKSERLAR
jgi:hypothetical protein